MIFNSFSQILVSPLVSRLVLLACAGVLFFVLRSKDAEGQAGSYIIAVAFLMLRDMALALLVVPGLPFIADIVYFSIVLFLIMAPFKDQRSLLVVVLLANVVVAGLFIVRDITGFGAIIPLYVFGLWLVLDALLVVLGGALGNRDKNNSAVRLISETWVAVSVILLVYAVALLVMGYDDLILSRIIAPLSYAWLFIVGLTGLRLQDNETLAAVSYYEASIDSLYNLSFRIGTALKGSFSTEDVLNSMNAVMITETGADGGSIYLVDEFDDVIVAKSYAGLFPAPFALPEAFPERLIV
ncbi:hypothetical protein MASR2M48_25150 [Spirochaetota bacterium]